MALEIHSGPTRVLGALGVGSQVRDSMSCDSACMGSRSASSLFISLKIENHGV